MRHFLIGGQIEDDALGGDLRHVNSLVDFVGVISDQLRGMEGGGGGRRKPATGPEPLHLSLANSLRVEHKLETNAYY